MLAMEVGRVLTARNWRHNDASKATGVSAGTISRMRHGELVKDSTIIRWAEGIGEDVNRWLSIHRRGLLGASRSDSYQEGRPVLELGAEFFYRDANGTRFFRVNQRLLDQVELVLDANETTAKKKN